MAVGPIDHGQGTNNLWTALKCRRTQFWKRHPNRTEWLHHGSCLNLLPSTGYANNPVHKSDMLYNNFNFPIHLIYLRNTCWRDEKQSASPSHTPPAPMFCLWFFFKGGQNADKKQFQMTVFLQSTKHLCFLLELSRYHTSLAAWDTRARMLTKLSSSPNPSLKFIKEAKVNFLLRSGFCLSRHSCRPPRREPETLEKKINQEETGLQPKLVKMLPARPISDYLCFVSNWHKTS